MAESVGGSWLVVLAERQHLQNWQEEMAKHGVLDDQTGRFNVEFVLYASLKKHIGRSYAGVILDEAHHCLSEKRIDALNSITVTKRILLSATFTEVQKKVFRSYVGQLRVAKISLSTAIKYGYIPKPRIVIHKLELDNFDKNHKAKIFGKKHYVTAKEKYDSMTGNIEYWKMKHYTDGEEWMRFKYLKAASDRKKFLSEQKTEYVKQLISKVSSKRYICFTGSIKQCDELGENGAIHSKSKDYSKVIKSFNQGDINHIFAVGMLKEGTNLENIEAGIIVQLSSKLRDFVQMLGRSLRSKSTPEQHILYFKETQDEVYLENVLKEIRDYVEMEGDTEGIGRINVC